MQEKVTGTSERPAAPAAGKKEGEYLVSLLRAALRNEPPMPAPDGINWQGLYALAERQLVAAAAWRAVKDLPGCPSDVRVLFSASADRALRKELLFDAARGEIFAAFDENSIDHMPLKGVLIKDMYPAKGMREFADNDILYREGDRAAVDKIMRSLGYASEGLESVHDVYKKPPVFNFELHRALFEERHVFAGYFDGIWERAVKEEGENRAYRMTEEDFYAYFTAHFQKHSESGGAGLRSFADMYFVRRNAAFDRGKAEEILQKIGSSDFERTTGEIAENLFGDVPMPVSDEIFSRIFPASVYGTMEKDLGNLFRREGRLRGALRLAFPPYAHMKTIYPVLKKAPVLLPFLWIARLFAVLFGKKRGKAAVAFKTFLQSGEKGGNRGKTDGEKR